MYCLNQVLKEDMYIIGKKHFKLSFWIFLVIFTWIQIYIFKKSQIPSLEEKSSVLIPLGLIVKKSELSTDFK